MLFFLIVCLFIHSSASFLLSVQGECASNFASFLTNVLVDTTVATGVTAGADGSIYVRCDDVAGGDGASFVATKEQIRDHKYMVTLCVAQAFSLKMVDYLKQPDAPLDCSEYSKSGQTALYVENNKHKKVFIDCGANVGDGLNALLPGEHKYMAKGVRKYMTDSVPYDMTEYFMYGFEGNPRFGDMLLDIQHQHPSRVKVFPKTVVTVEDKQNMPFYINHQANVNDWGSSLIKEKYNVDPDHPVYVTAVDFARFIKSVVIPRADKVPGRHVVVKMDIEGAEYTILPHLLINGAFCEIDVLLLECHPLEVSPLIDKKSFGNVMRYIAQQCNVTISGQTD